MDMSDRRGDTKDEHPKLQAARVYERRGKDYMVSKAVCPLETGDALGWGTEAPAVM